MAGWVFFVGGMFILCAVGARVSRSERRNSELAALDRALRVAYFWNRNTRAERKAYDDKLAEHKKWRNNIKFNFGNWSTFVIGAAILLIGAAIWFDDPAHTWDRFKKSAANEISYWGIAAFAVYYLYGLLSRLDKMER